MSVPILPEAEALEACADALEAGGVVVIPTDTVYGLAALPGDAVAMDRLFAMKGRGAGKSVAVLVADAAQARALSADPLDAVERFWPGPLTVVVHRSPAVTLHLGGEVATVGVRCPDHPFPRALARRLGPVAASSANLAGEPTPATAAEIAGIFADVVLVVDGGPLRGTASTVVDLTVAPPRLLREGPVTASDLGVGP